MNFLLKRFVNACVLAKTATIVDLELKVVTSKNLHSVFKI